MRAMERALASSCLVTMLTAAPAVGHEFWIEPVAERTVPGSVLDAHTKVGEMLDGVELGYSADRTNLLALIQNGEAHPISRRPGEIPAIRQQVTGDGIAQLVYVSHPSEVVWTDWADFQQFAEEDGLTHLLAQHEARGLPRSGFKELFSRSAKTLVAVGPANGTDSAVGLPFEIVLDQNPFTADLDGEISASLLLYGTPSPDTQVAIFRRARDESVVRETIRTDQEGRFSFPLSPGFIMLNAVHIDAPTDRLATKTGAVWHSQWSTLSFHITSNKAEAN